MKFAQCVNVHDSVCLVYTLLNSMHSHMLTNYSICLGGHIPFHFLSSTAPLLTKVIYASSDRTTISFAFVCCTFFRLWLSIDCEQTSRTCHGRRSQPSLLFVLLQLSFSVVPLVFRSATVFFKMALLLQLFESGVERTTN